MHHLIETPELATWTVRMVVVVMMRFCSPETTPRYPGLTTIMHTCQVTYATPSAPGNARILARFPFRFNDTRPTSLGSRLRRLVFSRVPDWMQHLQQNTVGWACRLPPLWLGNRGKRVDDRPQSV